MLWRFAIACTLVAALCFPVLAQDDSGRGINVSAGLFFTDSDVKDLVGSTGFAITAERKISESSSRQLYASLGYITASDTNEQYISGYGWADVKATVSIIPVMVTARFEPGSEDGESKRKYFGVGAGLTFMDVDVSVEDVGASGSETDFAWQLVGGMELGRNVFAEAKYLSGGRVGNTGFSINIGTRF